MATRSGRGRASSMLAKEKRSGLLDRAGKCLLLPGLGCAGRRRVTAVHLKAGYYGTFEAESDISRGSTTTVRVVGGAPTRASFSQNTEAGVRSRHGNR